MTPAQLKRLASQEPTLLRRLYALEALAVERRQQGLGLALAAELADVRGEYTVAARAVRLIAERAGKR